MTEHWLSIVEYARTYDVSDMTIRRRIKNGKLHAVLKDGKYYIPIEGSGNKPTLTTNKPDHSIVKNHPKASQTHSDSSSIMPRVRPDGPIVAPAYTNLRREEQQVKVHEMDPVRNDRLDTMVSSQSLLDYCDRSLKRVLEAEDRLKAEHAMSVKKMELEVKNRDLLISQLKQQVEDMQCLIRILESQKPRPIR